MLCLCVSDLAGTRISRLETRNRPARAASARIAAPVTVRDFTSGLPEAVDGVEGEVGKRGGLG